MSGLGKQLKDFGQAGESIERILDAIRFQTSILTLNAALETAQPADPRMGVTALAGQLRNVAEQIAGGAAQGGGVITSAATQHSRDPSASHV